MEGLTYIFMILGWATPIIVLHWVVGRRALLDKWPHVVVSVTMATLYLGTADVAAIHNGVWSINPEKTVQALSFGSFVFEEWLFFLVTNILVVQTVILLYDEPLRERALALARRLSRS